jgi:uncharacterized protein (TIGR00730 family)
MPAICVYCSSSERIDERYLRLAADVGTELARRGHTLVSGGGTVSMMGAVARAARAGGARTVGVIPRALLPLEVADHDADELVVTTDMRERKGEMERRADAFLALPGGLGTFEELFEIWVGLTLGLHGKPVVVLDPDGVLSHLRKQVDASVEAGFVRPEGRDVVDWATTVDEALDAIEARWKAGPPAPTAPAALEMLEAEP